ncbi:hypothetical protein TW81_05010 [Vibrio galatheae]|uniref:Acyltransferase 3 domain-containing protein n=1 Tax=Vibrio galatheae TaxID=579748 RepID=A0A0F4NLV2_9VIBR|nr:acyltransferase [Vibrio galatheae]KJY84160.1 hypothetical protein TW81_05010 [Vibrio galatheae]
MVDSKRIETIQFIRGVASILVAWIHAIQFFPGHFSNDLFDESSNVVSIGGFGVDIFFIISGFVIALNVDKKPSLRQFVVSRFVRVVPLYWLYTIAFYLFMLFFASSYDFLPIELLYSMLFIPYENQFGAFQPILAVGWSLNYEILFYVIMSILILMKVRNFLLFLFLAFILVLPFFYKVIILEFLFGYILFYFYRNDFYLNIKLAFFILISSLVLLFTTATYVYETGGSVRLIIWGGGGAVLLYSIIHFEKYVCLLPKSLFSWLTLWGTVSYTLYLSHWFVGFVSYKILNFLPDTLQVLVTFAIMLVIAVPLYFVLEKPIIGHMRRLIK